MPRGLEIPGLSAVVAALSSCLPPEVPQRSLFYSTGYKSLTTPLFSLFIDRNSSLATALGLPPILALMPLESLLFSSFAPPAFRADAAALRALTLA